MRRLTPLLLLVSLACHGPTKTDDTDSPTDTDSTPSTDTDGTAQDTDVVAQDTDVVGDPNAKAVGVWSLATAASTCTMSFAGDWTGTASTANTLAFTLTQAIEGGQTLSCLFDAVNPNSFTCGDVSTGGYIPPNCTVGAQITAVSGTVSGTAASLSSTIQVTSPNCGLALNCGPLPHMASGTIAR